MLSKRKYKQADIYNWESDIKRKKKIMSKDVSCQLKHKDATCRSEGEIMDYGLKKREGARARTRVCVFSPLSDVKELFH